MQKRAVFLEVERLSVSNVAEHLFPARPTEMTVSIELERQYGNRAAVMAPLGMPELLDMLTENPITITEEDASTNLAPSTPYLRALAAQVSPSSDVRYNQVIEADRPRFLQWFTTVRTKLSPDQKFRMRQSSPATPSAPKQGGKSGEKTTSIGRMARKS